MIKQKGEDDDVCLEELKIRDEKERDSEKKCLEVMGIKLLVNVVFRYFSKNGIVIWELSKLMSCTLAVCFNKLHPFVNFLAKTVSWQ